LKGFLKNRILSRGRTTAIPKKVLIRHKIPLILVMSCHGMTQQILYDAVGPCHGVAMLFWEDVGKKQEHYFLFSL